MPGRHPSFLDLELGPENETYVLKAGLVHGITEGSLIGVYSHYNDVPFNKCLGLCRVESIEGFHATVHPFDNSTRHMLCNRVYARVLLPWPERKLRVHFEGGVEGVVDEDSVRNAWIGADRAAVGDPGVNYEGFVWFCVVDRSGADLVVLVDGGHTRVNTRVKFHMMTKLAAPYEFVQLEAEVGATAQDVSRVLHSASSWIRRLDHTNLQLNSNFALKGRMELIPLNPKYRMVRGQLDRRFVREKDGGIPVENGIIDLAVKPGQLYGIQIFNDIDSDLYPYLFYLNPRTLGIDTFYPESTSCDRTVLVLKGGESLTVGDGQGGGDPFEFNVDNRQFDVGFLKLLLTTVPLDPEELPDARVRSIIRTEVGIPDLKGWRNWRTSNITVIQHP